VTVPDTTTTVQANEPSVRRAFSFFFPAGLGYDAPRSRAAVGWRE
jgi:hypothetical protein